MGGGGEGPPTRVLDSLGDDWLYFGGHGVGKEGMGWGVAVRDPPLES